MKLNKSILKEIVKECLVEILAEGIVGANSRHSLQKKVALNESINAHSNNILKQRSLGGAATTESYGQKNKRPGYLDSISFNQSEAVQPNKQYENKINNTVANLAPQNKVMQDIFSDTANTTLMEQAGAEGRKGAMSSRPADQAAQIVSENNPDELFGEASQKWASLAFM